MRSEVDLFHRVAPLAESPAEVWSVVLLVARHGLARLSRYRVLRENAVMHLQGRTCVVGLVSGEVDVFPEIYQERIYDRREDFIPAPGWTVFDVGANVGLFSLLQAGRGAQVYAFEPNQECFRRLVQNVAGNVYSGAVSAHNLALGGQPDTATLRVPWGKTHSGSLARDRPGETFRQMPIAVTTLDHLVHELGISRIDLLKIDVEGWELEVLRGAGEALAVTDRVMVEYHSQALRRQTCDRLGAAGLVPVTDLPCYPPDVGVLYARRATDGP